MTKLEEEIWIAITNGHMRPYQCKSGGIEPGIIGTEEAAKAAAEVAKKYITKAIIELSDMNTERIDTNEWREKWLKDNGII